MILACPFCKAKADPAVSTCSSCGKLYVTRVPRLRGDDCRERDEVQVLR